MFKKPEVYLLGRSILTIHVLPNCEQTGRSKQA